VTSEHGFITLIPVNRLERAKGRLEKLLTPEERSTLAMITTRTVVDAAVALGPVAILTADEAVKTAFGAEARILNEDPGLRGLNPQLESGLKRLGEYRSILILHADLPLASTAQLSLVSEGAKGEGSVAIVRPADGGTNAMLLRPPGRFALAYGTGSCALHTKAAEDAGMAVATVESADLEVDLDTPEDVAALLASETGRASKAGQFLLVRGVEGRLDAS